MMPMTPLTPNTGRACVKSPGVKFGNDQIFDMARFDELSRWDWMVEKRVFTQPRAGPNGHSTLSFGLTDEDWMPLSHLEPAASGRGSTLDR